MYKVKETFEYLVDDCNDFCSVHDALEMDTDMPCPCWDGSKIPVGGEERSIPWGDSVIEVINNAISIDVDTLLKLIKNSEKLAALEAEGVDNWEGYSLAMKELNTGYQKDAITDEVLIKQYCE